MTNSQNRKVSVVVPNYNYARYLRRRLASIAAQTYPIYEIIILDDASTDKSVSVIERTMAEIDRKHNGIKWKLIRNEHNSGNVIKQWIKGVNAATGDFVWIAEADDSCSRKFLEGLIQGFNNSEVVLSYSESRIINGLGVMIAPNFRWSRDKEKTGHFAKSYVKGGKDEICEIMAVRCTIPNVSAVVFKKTPKLIQFLKEAERYKQVGDWYLYLRLLEHGKIAYEHGALNYFRIHGGSATKRGQEHYDEVVQMHEMIKNKYDLSEVVLQRMKAEEERILEKYDIIKRDK